MTTPYKVFAGAVIVALLGPGATVAAEPGARPAAVGGFASPGKPGAQVALAAVVRTPGDGKPAVAQQLDVELELVVPPDAQALALAVAPGDLLTLISGGHARFMQPDGAVRHVVSVVAQAEGKHYLNVSVLLQRHGETRMRSFAVPLRVGAPFGVSRSATKGLVTRNSDGEAIVITRSR